MSHPSSKHEVTCALTRELVPKDEAVKLVVSPDHQLVADLDDILPSKAVWVGEASALATLVRDEKQVHVLFDDSVSVDADFMPKLCARVRKELLQMLALSKKAGQLIVGGQKVKQALNQGDIALVFQSSGGSERELSKLVQGAYKHVLVCDDFSSNELAGILGQNHIGYVALVKGALAKKIMKRLSMWQAWQEFSAQDGE